MDQISICDSILKDLFMVSNYGNSSGYIELFAGAFLSKFSHQRSTDIFLTGMQIMIERPTPSSRLFDLFFLKMNCVLSQVACLETARTVLVCQQQSPKPLSQKYWKK